ncbi:hypothetical protein M413DRAFT_423881 [Hebeloma cylindrosporum]|uniref:non-specific serine/threonine protein kinase n=1 Tax=Hebeloma cylindrosporum TaxID=76867 RepID=A0A0C3C018_HEBCY|nr:hypothetical protein M413DRAFT_423881 [Hebeloma cylindrosporum h7]
MFLRGFFKSFVAKCRRKRIDKGQRDIPGALNSSISASGTDTQEELSTLEECATSSRHTSDAPLVQLQKDEKVVTSPLALPARDPISLEKRCPGAGEGEPSKRDIGTILKDIQVAFQNLKRADQDVASSPPMLEEQLAADGGASSSRDPPPEMPHPQSEGEIIGAGGTATVYRIFSESLGRYRAVKVIQLCAEDIRRVVVYASREASIFKKVQKGKEEARALGKTVHPGLERVLGGPDDFVNLGDNGCLRIETASRDFYPTNLSAYQGILSQDQEALMTIIVEIAEGLNYLHIIGIVHNDITLWNIFLTRTGHCVIGDYGSSLDFERFKIPALGLVPSSAVKLISAGSIAPEVAAASTTQTFGAWGFWHQMFDPQRPHNHLDYIAMGLFYPSIIQSNMEEKNVPESVITLLLGMCQLQAFNRPNAADVLREISQRGWWPQADSIDPSKPSPLSRYPLPARPPVQPDFIPGPKVFPYAASDVIEIFQLFWS